MTASVAHVPAWKKLGLKLKYAKETQIEPLNNDKMGQENRKRIFQDDENVRLNMSASAQLLKKPKRPRLTGATSVDVSSQVKEKRRPSDIGDEKGRLTSTCSFQEMKRHKEHKESEVVPLCKTAPAVCLTSTITSTPTVALSADKSTTSTSPTKRKSVSFTPETKIVDGDSAKKLSKTWFSQNDFGSSDDALKLLGPSVVDANFKIDQLISETSTPRSVEDQTNLEASIITKPPSFLQYLRNYHTSRSTWKFNKSKQIQILKHAFDLQRIPQEDEDALQSYLSGLSGSAARQRLREQAIDILEGTQGETPDTPLNDKQMESFYPSSNKLVIIPVDPDEDKEFDYKSIDPKIFEPSAEHLAKEKKRRASELRHAATVRKHAVKKTLLEREEMALIHDEDYISRMIKRKRAEAILMTIGEVPPLQEEDQICDPSEYAILIGSGENAFVLQPGRIGMEDDPNGRQVIETRWNGELGRTMAPVKLPKKKRKRKRRTGVPDDDTSSEESISSDEEVIDEEKAEKQDTTNTKSSAQGTSPHAQPGNRDGSTSDTNTNETSEDGSSEDGSGEDDSGKDDSGKDGSGKDNFSEERMIQLLKNELTG